MSTSIRIRPRSGETAFTLIELLIAMFLAIIVMLAIYLSFENQQRSFLTEDMTARTQLNLRIGMLMVTREVRSAGAAIGNTGVSGTDEGTNMWPGIRIEDNNPDIIHIVYSDASCSAKIEEPMPPTSAEVNVDDVSCIQDGDLLMITQADRYPSILRVTHVQPAASKIQHNSGMSGRDWNESGNRNWPGPPTYVGSGYGQDPPGLPAYLYKVRLVSFRINPATNMLQMDTSGNAMSANVTYSSNPQWVDIAENITDLQANYIFANGSTGTTYDDTNADPDDDYAAIRSVQITMTAQTAKPLPNSITTAAPAGTRRTRTLQETVRLRNFGLN